MNCLFHVFFAVLLSGVQVAVIPAFFSGAGMYDLFIPYIFFLAFSRPFLEGLAAGCGMGLLADSLSAAPFGLYITVYLWFFFLIRWGMTVLQINNRMFLPPVMILGVLGEGAVFLADALPGGRSGGLHHVLRIFAWQMFWGGLTGPFVFTAVSVFHRKWKRGGGNLLFPERVH